MMKRGEQRYGNKDASFCKQALQRESQDKWANRKLEDMVEENIPALKMLRHNTASE